jgi:hypothetical protein
MVNEGVSVMGSALEPVTRRYVPILSGAGNRPIALPDRLRRFDLVTNGANAPTMGTAGHGPAVVKRQQLQRVATMQIRFQLAPAAPVVAATKGES